MAAEISENLSLYDKYRFPLGLIMFHSVLSLRPAQVIAAKSGGRQLRSTRSMPKPSTASYRVPGIGDPRV